MDTTLDPITDAPASPTHIYKNNNLSSQRVTILRTGTAAKGRVDFGATEKDSYRLMAGDRLIHLHTLSTGEAIIATHTMDPLKRELLILTKHTHPATSTPNYNP